MWDWNKDTLLGLTHELRNHVDAERLAAGYRSRRREASALGGFPDLKQLARHTRVVGAAAWAVGAARRRHLNFSLQPYGHPTAGASLSLWEKGRRARDGGNQSFRDILRKSYL
ncbi:hypothetical protein [Nostoc sp.]|uniref:hypothetical protein n=1 Tax=Nostoc sp. TaxID=1180 RepID=UPI002FF682C2